MKKHIVVLTGAGMSAESGIKTFRDADGLWEGHDVDFYKIDVDKNQVDDALGVAAMPKYLFIKNSNNLEQIEGAMTKARMEGLINKHMSANSSSTSYDNTEFNFNDFSQANIDKIWNSSSKLNSMAWNAYKNINNVSQLLKSIKIVERSIELEKTTIM